MTGGASAPRNAFSRVATAPASSPRTVTLADAELSRRQRRRSRAACRRAAAPRPWPRHRARRTRWSQTNPALSGQAAGCRQPRTGGRMTISVGRYTFASWLRRGIGTRIVADRQARRRRSGAANERATVPIDVTLNGAGMSQGLRADRSGRRHRHQPADGRAHRAAQLDHQLRAELPRRSSSSTMRTSCGATRRRSPNGDKLRPWLALLVLKKPDDGESGEFELVNRASAAVAAVTAPAALPPLDARLGRGPRAHQRGLRHAHRLRAFL